MSLDQVVQGLENELGLVEDKVREVLQSANPLLKTTTEYFLQSSGKRLRPILVLLSGGFTRFDHNKLISLAASLELVHMASLLHDDVIDHGDIRRGIPTVNIQWGNHVAVLLGDFFYAKALALVADLGNEGVRSVSETINALAEGEFEQLTSQFNTSITEKDYLRTIERKSAHFIATCCKLGALYSDASGDVVKLLTEYGHNLGMAYQIRDDILDFVATSTVSGKPVGSDVSQGIMTLPLIHGLTSSNKSSQIQGMIDNGKPDFYSICQLLQDTGSLDYAQKKVEQFSGKARECLLPLPEGKSKSALSLILDMTTVRVS